MSLILSSAVHYTPDLILKTSALHTPIKKRSLD